MKTNVKNGEPRADETFVTEARSLINQAVDANEGTKLLEHNAADLRTIHAANRRSLAHIASLLLR
jgi:hypothetical protein